MKARQYSPPTAPRALAPWRVALATAAVYALLGALALLMAVSPGYASPLYPAAGLALAAMLRYGRAALPGIWLGSFAVNTAVGLLHGQAGAASLALPLVIGVGAALQAALGAALVRRFVAQPLVLNAPRDILRFGVLGALVACGVSPTVATPALLAAGAISFDSMPLTWLTWWVGDTLGVLIAAPLVLTLIGRPRGDWQPRRRTLGLPLLLALALLAVGMVQLSRLERERAQTSFERDADRLANAAEARLSVPLYALQALHSAARLRVPLDREALIGATGWWLAQQPSHLLAMGYSERVTVDALPAFEAAARDQGQTGYRVFERDGGAARAADHEVLALRLITPAAGNSAALGVNVLSVPAARAAVLASRDSGAPTVSEGFRLTQASGDETGVVIYQALYSGEGGDTAARRRQFRGVVFVTVPTEMALTGLAPAALKYLRWCLVDATPAAPRKRLSGLAGCETDLAPAAGPSIWRTSRPLVLGDRTLLMHVSAPEGVVPGRQGETAWILSLAGLAATSMLGALLLTVTGHSRRTGLAVTVATGDLRREIVERSSAEQALRESEARLRSILDHVPLGVMFLDPQGRLIDCNPRLAAMLGHGIDDLRTRSVSDIVHADETWRIRDLRRELLAGADSCELGPLRLLGAGGHEMLVRVTASALRAPDGAVLRMVGVVEDITEHLRLLSSERALQHAEAASRAKSEFLSRMSHELRTPLNAMIGFAQLLGLTPEAGLAAQQREWVHQIQRAGWHLLEMINETLDLARIESGAVQMNLAPLALPPLLAACWAMVATPAAQRNIRFDEALDADACGVLGDATRLKQVLTNLLSNAVKYNVDGGSVSFSARRELHAEGDVVVIDVADTGLGMTPVQLAALFQPYNRLGRENSAIEGTGIGLVISRRLAELMGGTLQATSTAGQGSLFTLRLPATDAAEARPRAGTDSSPAPYRQRLVHYVEDNETNVELMRGVFAQRPQIRLEVSTLGLDGLGAIRATRPDLVLLDMHLPDISGLELLRHLKQDDSVADIPVVVVSADATTQQTQQALTSGALHYITKPVDMAHLLQIVDAILEAADTRWG